MKTILWQAFCLLVTIFTFGLIVPGHASAQAPTTNEPSMIKPSKELRERSSHFLKRKLDLRRILAPMFPGVNAIARSGPLILEEPPLNDSGLFTLDLLACEGTFVVNVTQNHAAALDFAQFASDRGMNGVVETLGAENAASLARKKIVGKSSMRNAAAASEVTKEKVAAFTSGANAYSGFSHERRPIEPRAAPA